MSFANTTAHSEWSANSGKTYVSTGNFGGAFYTYTASTNASLQTVGALTTVATAANGSTSLFGGGHHLVLNGRKLTPGVNPMNSITGNTTTGLTYNPFVYGSTPGAATVTLSPSGAGANTNTSVTNSTFAPKFMVGVADIQTGLNGFIDPTNVLFALYDKNRPVTDYLVDMATGLSEANARVTVSSGQSDRINAKSIVVGGTTPSIGGSSTGQIRIFGTTTTPSLVVSSSIVTPSSIILLTPTNVSPTVTVVASILIGTTTLTVTSVTTGTILLGMTLPLAFTSNTVNALQILSQLTGTTGGVGTYLVSIAATAAGSGNLTLAADNAPTGVSVSAVGTGTFTVNVTAGGSLLLPSVVNFLIIN